jgi:hypothetical protein
LRTCKKQRASVASSCFRSRTETRQTASVASALIYKLKHEAREFEEVEGFVCKKQQRENKLKNFAK